MRTITERTTATLTATEAALLGLLALRGEQSGYDLRKAVDASVGYFWKPAKTQIYAVLPRLVAAGLATRRAVVQPDRPDKHVYSPTEAGRTELTAWLEAPPADGDRDTFLMRVFLGGLASPAALRRNLQARREEAEALKAELEAIDARSGAGPRDFHASLTRRYGLAHADAVIRWASEVERELEP